MTARAVPSGRVSIPYRVATTANNYRDISYYSHMFAEDVSQHLFPFDGHVNHKAVFQLSPPNGDAARIIEAAFTRDDHGGHRQTLSPILSEFGNRAAHRVVLSGSETFEVVPNVDRYAAADSFLVVRVNGTQSVAGAVWQLIPKNALVGAHGDTARPLNRRLVRLPKDRVIQMKLPREFRRIPGGLRALHYMGKAVPSFVIQNYKPDGTGRVPYDLEEMKGFEQRAVAAIMRSTGWDGRWAFQDAVTGYYTMRRFLRFEEFKIELREMVVDTINRILTVAGARLGFTSVVRLHHLPTRQQIATSRKDLAEGRFDYVEAMTQYSIHL